MLKIILLFVLGLLFIIKGGDWFVDAAGYIAEATGIPKLIIGATIVSLATTLPEQLVSVLAVLGDSNDLGIGNAVGSISCNIGIALAISAFFLPSEIKRKDFVPKGILMLISAILLWIFCRDGILMPKEGMALFVCFLIFIALNIKGVKDSQSEDIDRGKRTVSIKLTTINIFKFAVGALGIVMGARLLVDNGTLLARNLGVSEAVIGLTLIAIGTSLPEIVTTISSVMKKESGMSVGNILGANIINITLILSVCSFFSGKGLTVGINSIKIDIPIAIFLIILAVLPTIYKGRFMRWQGIAMFGVYGVYLVATVLFL